MFVDIQGLKRANDELGHEFGDKVILAASRAVTKSVRAGDVVARWGGDDRRKWSGALSVGFAEGRLTIESIDDIIGRADDDMYRRREVR